MGLVEGGKGVACLGTFSAWVGGTDLGGSMEIPEDELMERLMEILGEWQVDVLIEVIRKQPAWVAVGKDPVEGFVGVAPPEKVWRLN